jgi:hypothetical protein
VSIQESQSGSDSLSRDQSRDDRSTAGEDASASRGTSWTSGNIYDSRACLLQNTDDVDDKENLGRINYANEDIAMGARTEHNGRPTCGSDTVSGVRGNNSYAAAGRWRRHKRTASSTASQFSCFSINTYDTLYEEEYNSGGGASDSYRSASEQPAARTLSPAHSISTLASRLSGKSRNSHSSKPDSQKPAETQPQSTNQDKESAKNDTKRKERGQERRHERTASRRASVAAPSDTRSECRGNRSIGSFYSHAALSTASGYVYSKEQQRAMAKRIQRMKRRISTEHSMNTLAVL